MANDILISIHPEHVENIVSRKKDHEFRKYLPREETGRIWIYVTAPVSALKYIADIGSPVTYPQKLPETGIGNKEFNAGLKKSKYAIPILHLEELRHEIDYRELHRQFNISPPQMFMYLDNPALLDYVQKTGVKKVF